MTAAAAAAPIAKVSTDIIDAFQEWNGSKRDASKIKKAAREFGVFGGTSNLRLPKELSAQSPLMDHIKDNCTANGTIYVVYASNAVGKTTACCACMDKPYFRRGVVFSPDCSSMPYFDALLSLFNFSSKKSQRGFMELLVDELQSGYEPKKKSPIARVLSWVKKDPSPRTSGQKDEPLNTNKRNVIILDNFMPDGFNDRDRIFLSELKAKIRGSLVSAIVMTSNKNAASLLLAENMLQYIVPLAGIDVLLQLSRDNARNSIQRGTPIDLDWDKHVSMKWDEKELLKAVEQSKAFSLLSDEEKESVRQRFNLVYSQLSEIQQNKATPNFMMKWFKEITGKDKGCATPTNTAGRCALPIVVSMWLLKRKPTREQLVLGYLYSYYSCASSSWGWWCIGTLRRCR